MNVFETHRQIVDDYAQYIRSFINISDPEIARKVEDSLSEGRLWPQPLLQFNPAYERGGTIEEVIGSGLLHEDVRHIFTGYSLYRHQCEAIGLGVGGTDFVVTSGTGSGKSVTYIGTIFNHLLANRGVEGGAAVIVYPMNALINSQTNEFNTYKDNYERRTGRIFPITFGQYTGQEKEERRQLMREAPPPASPPHQLHDARTPTYSGAGAAHSRCHFRESPLPRLRRASHLPWQAGRGRRHAHPAHPVPMQASDRRVFLANVLDYFRLEYAIHSENYLVPNRLKEFEKRFREQLKAPWTLDADEELAAPSVIRLDPLHRRARLSNKSMGPASSLGKYIKHVAKQAGVDSNLLRGDHYRDFILRLMHKLKDADYLFEETARNANNEEVPVFRLRIEKILWKLGDGETVRPDPIKRRAYKNQTPTPNAFFREIYRRDFTESKRLAAADHSHAKRENYVYKRSTDTCFPSTMYRDCRHGHRTHYAGYLPGAAFQYAHCTPTATKCSLKLPVQSFSMA